MLPEQAIRLLLDTRRSRLRNSPQVDVAFERLNRHFDPLGLSRWPMTDYEILRIPKPETLTGDDWRAAWAEAHDKATDKALGAVY